MADLIRNRRAALRSAREAAFALCTVWLVFQNLVLVALLPWGRLPEFVSKYAAILKAAALVLGPVWAVGTLALLGWMFVNLLARGTRDAGTSEEWERNHGRAR